MSERLVPCESCRRHVFEKESTCPFCGAKGAATRGRGGVGLAVALSVGIAGVACGGGQSERPPANDSTVAIPAPPASAPIVPQASATPAPRPTASAPPKPLHRGNDDPAPIYGGPPPG